MITASRPLALLLLLTQIAACRNEAAPAPLDDERLRDFGRAQVTVLTDTGEHLFRVYVASDQEQGAQGLMFIESLPDDAGMLFVFGTDRQASMWMKNTLLSLDMLFIRGDGSIANIAAETTPGSLQSVPSAGAVKAVLELNGGTAARLGITPGDRVRFPRQPSY